MDRRYRRKDGTRMRRIDRHWQWRGIFEPRKNETERTGLGWGSGDMRTDE